MMDIGGEVPNQENTSKLKNVKPKRSNYLPNLKVMPTSTPLSPSNSSKSTPTSPSSASYPNVIEEVMKIKKGKKHF